MLVLWKLFCRNHQDRQIVARFPEHLGKGISVYTWHHDIEDDQVDMFSIQNIHGSFAVFCGKNRIVLPFENGFEQSARIFVVICDQ